MAPSHNRCIVRPSVAEFDETVRQIFEIFGEAMETSGPQLTKNLEVRRCLEKMLEQNEAGFRADMKQTDDWNECRLARIRAAVLTRRLMTQQLSLVEREAREKAEQRLQAVEEDLHFASDLCQLHQRWRDSVMEIRQGHGFQEKEATPVLEADGASEAPEEEQFAGCPAAPAVLLGKTRRVTQDKQDEKMQPEDPDEDGTEGTADMVDQMLHKHERQATPFGARCIWSQTSGSPDSESQRSEVLRSFESQATTAESPM